MTEITNSAGLLADVIFAVSCVTAGLCVLVAIIEIGEIINLMKEKDRQ